MNFFSKFIRRFARDERATISVETVLAFPMLVWVSVAAFTFFDAYKLQNAIFRANYTIGDILSRETGEVDQAYLNTMHNLMLFMTHAPNDGSWMRVTVVHCKQFCDQAKRKLDVDWSNSTGGAVALTKNDSAFLDQYVPWLPKGDRLILVETVVHYDPPFGNLVINFPARDIVTHSVTRPRFAPQLVWAKITGP